MLDILKREQWNKVKEMSQSPRGISLKILQTLFGQTPKSSLIFDDNVEAASVLYESEI